MAANRQKHVPDLQCKLVILAHSVGCWDLRLNLYSNWTNDLADAQLLVAEVSLWEAKQANYTKFQGSEQIRTC